MRISRLGLILGLGLVASVVLAQSSKKSMAQDKRPDNIPAEEWKIVLLVNQDRTAAGLTPLKWDSALAVAARKHCLRIAMDGEISHQSEGEPNTEEQASDAGAHVSLVLENLGTGSVLDGIHQQWVDSPDDRANMLTPDVDRVGVGVVSIDGTLYAVADFARSAPGLTQDQVEAAIAGLLRDQGLYIGHDPSDARALCAGRRVDTLNVQPSYATIWETADLTQLPADLAKLLRQALYRKATVGNCPVSDANKEFSFYRVAALFYKVGDDVH